MIVEQVIRKRVKVEPGGRIQLRAEELRGAAEAEVIVIVEPGKAQTTPALFQSIAAYAAAHARTDVDLDTELESDSLELWREAEEAGDL